MIRAAGLPDHMNCPKKYRSCDRKGGEDAAFSKAFKAQRTFIHAGFHFPKGMVFADADILTDDAVRAEPLIIRKAMMFACVSENLPIKIFEDELIVGVLNSGGPAVGTLMPSLCNR